MNRRQFLKATTAAGLGAVAQGQDEPTVILREPPRPLGTPSMWLGGVTPTGGIVKAKLPLGVGSRLLVHPPEGEPLSFLPEPRQIAGGTVVTFRPSGLRPATEHRYSLEVNGKPSIYPEGRLRTFPEEGKPAPVRFAFSSCARTGSEHPVFEAIRARKPDVFLHLGDLHYENISRPEPRIFRAAWDTVLSSTTQSALYRDVPLAYIWDDHDFGPNNADGRSPSRAAARAVYREYAPHYLLPAGSRDAAIYQAFSIARVRFILTDLRSERAADRDLPNATLLGTGQKEWLKQELATASKTHAAVFWASSVPWVGTRNTDSWASYADERREIANFIAHQGIRNLCILCGDAHMLAADDGSQSRYADADAAAIPVLHGSSLDQGGSYKGGPYSHGYYIPQYGEGCFGWVEVTDDGSSVEVAFSGLVDTGEEKVAHRFRFHANG